MGRMSSPWPSLCSTISPISRADSWLLAWFRVGIGGFFVLWPLMGEAPCWFVVGWVISGLTLTPTCPNFVLLLCDFAFAFFNQELPHRFVFGWVIFGLVLPYHCLDLLLLACDFGFIWWIWPPLCFALLFHFLLLFLMVSICSTLFCCLVWLMYYVARFWKI